MLHSNLRPEGERFLRGEGPRQLRVPGGGGRWPTYAGDAYAFSVALPLTSVSRFRLMYALCRREWEPWARGPALAQSLGLHVNTVYGALHGMKDMHLVENRRAAVRRRSSSNRLGEAHAMEWAATAVGRVMLWRSARMSAEVLSFVWDEVEMWMAGRSEAWEAAEVAAALAKHLEPPLTGAGGPDLQGPAPDGGGARAGDGGAAESDHGPAAGLGENGVDRGGVAALPARPVPPGSASRGVVEVHAGGAARTARPPGGPVLGGANVRV